MPYNGRMNQAPTITYEQAIQVFDKPAKLARALGVSRASVSEWSKKGVLPEGRVWQLIALRPDRFGHLQPNGAQPQLELEPHGAAG